MNGERQCEENENPIEAKQSKAKQSRTVQRQVRQYIKTGFDCRLTLIGSTNMYSHTHTSAHEREI